MEENIDTNPTRNLVKPLELFIQISHTFYFEDIFTNETILVFYWSILTSWPRPSFRPLTTLSIQSSLSD